MPISSEEITELSAHLTPDDLYRVMLAKIDRHMSDQEFDDRKDLTADQKKELVALVDACVAYEAVMFPIAAINLNETA